MNFIQKLKRIKSIAHYEGLHGVLGRVLGIFLKKDSAFNTSLNFTPLDLEENRLHIESAHAKQIHIKTINWFIPYSESKPAGGRMTIFRFANLFKKRGIHSRFIFTGNKFVRQQAVHDLLQKFTPWISEEDIFIEHEVGLERIPFADVSFATRWDSAFTLLRFNNTDRKAYFVQDFEPLLYPAGKLYSLAELSYSFGFYGVVNSPQLLKDYTHYSPKALQFTPGIDRTIYHSIGRTVNKKIRILFYGRPQNPRNGFDLGIEALRIIKQKYGAAVEITAVGSMWNESDYHLRDVLKNVGFFNNTKKLADLYRSCDIGLAFVFSKGFPLLSYEMMASGLALVTNMSEAHKRVFKDNHNAILALPSAHCVAERISDLIENKKLLHHVADSGLHLASQVDEDMEAQRIINFLQM